MISGYKNLRYLAFGKRRYGPQPVLANTRWRWEFEFIFKGRARPTGVNAPTIKRETPRLYVFHPESPHGWTDEPDGISEIFVVQFQEVPDELKECVKPTKPIIIELNESTHQRFYNQLQELKESTAACNASTSLKLQQLLVDLAVLVVSQSSTDPGLRTNPADKVNRALLWFEENLGNHPSVEDAARSVNVSSAHLRRLFAEAGRPSPKMELARLQVKAAQRCLLEGWTQKAVADFLGFSETSTFARAFRDACGQPPGAWLIQYQQKPKR